MTAIMVIGSVELSDGIEAIASQYEEYGELAPIKECLTQEVPQMVLRCYSGQGVDISKVIGQEIVFRIKFVSVEQGLTEAVKIMAKEVL